MNSSLKLVIMGNKCLIILLILLSSSGLKAQFDIIWQRTMGGTSSDEVYDITTAPNGGIFLVGRTASSNFDIFGHHGGFDFFIAKLDSVGNTVWKKTLGGSNNETPYAVQYTADGGCLVLGSTKSNDQDIQNYHGGLSDGWLLRLDESGNIVWQKTLGGSEWDELYSMIALKEGNYLLVGSSRSTDGDVIGNLGNHDVWVLEVTENGEIIWGQTYGGSQDDIARQVIESKDGSILIIGETWSDDGYIQGNNGNVDIWAIKLTPDGQYNWSKTYGGEGADFGRFIREASDGYLLGGMTGSDNNGDVQGFHGLLDIWVVKINFDGNLQWQRAIGGSQPDRAYQLELLEDGSCIVVGGIESNDGDFTDNDGGADLALVKVSPDGDLLWQQTFGGSKAEVGFAIDRTPDDGFVVAGYTWSTNGDLTGIPNKGYNDFWILKLSPETMSATEEAEAEPILLYPNPAADMVNISVPEPYSELQIIITDASGIAVLQKDVINGGAVSLAGLPAGIYTFHARMPDGRVRTGKLVKY